MQQVCDTALQAESKTIHIVGKMAITSPTAKRHDVFQRLSNPRARMATLIPASNVIIWRDEMLLRAGFRATLLAWPVEATLPRGLELDELDGMPSWKAEQASKGLLDNDAQVVDTATWILSENAGAVLRLPGAKQGLIVDEEEFASCVRIGEPIYFTELSQRGTFEAARRSSLTG